MSRKSKIEPVRKYLIETLRRIIERQAEADGKAEMLKGFREMLSEAIALCGEEKKENG